MSLWVVGIAIAANAGNLDCFVVDCFQEFLAEFFDFFVDAFVFDFLD